VTGRRGRRRRKLLDDLKERRGYSHLKEEALDRSMWGARFGRGFGPVVRQTTKCMSRGHPVVFSDSVPFEHEAVWAREQIWLRVEEKTVSCLPGFEI